MELAESEVVANIEDYNQFSKINSIGPPAEVEEPTTANNIRAMRAAAPKSPIEGVPATVFTTRGKWGSRNNPSFQNMGYYAETGAYAGTANNVTFIIQWEYGYNTPGAILSKKTTTGIGATWLEVTNVGAYIYRKHANDIWRHFDTPYFKIQKSAMAVGLKSSQQIMTYADSTMRSNKWAIDWRSCKSLLGLLPYGKYFSTAATLFDAVKYESYGNVNPNYGDTARKQQNIYGKENLKRAHKLDSNGHALSNVKDHITIAYQITSPPDLSRSVKYQYVSNKYFFEISRSSIFDNTCLYRVTEYRDVSYFVYKF